MLSPALLASVFFLFLRLPPPLVFSIARIALPAAARLESFAKLRLNRRGYFRAQTCGSLNYRGWRRPTREQGSWSLPSIKKEDVLAPVSTWERCAKRRLGLSELKAAITPGTRLKTEWMSSEAGRTRAPPGAPTHGPTGVIRSTGARTQRAKDVVEPERRGSKGNHFCKRP